MLTHRLATEDDLAALEALMAQAIGELQRGFLDEAQIVASRQVMGLDSQLIADRTYFLVEFGVAQGRAVIAALLDPAVDAARVRAMYTHPAFARRGVGRLILSLCEAAAANAGFSRVQLMATLSGEPLYRAAGYEAIEHTAAAPVNGVVVPLILMGKALS